MKTVLLALMLVFSVIFSSDLVRAQTIADEEMAWVTDRDDTFFYLAYAIPESDRFAIAFVCTLKDKKTFVVLHEKEDAEVKAGDKFPLTLQIGETKTVLQAETSFEASEEMLRSIAPLASDNPILSLLGTDQTLKVIRADKTEQFSLADISDRFEEFRQGCGLKK